MGIKTTVLGIGNLLLMDEGVGVHAIVALRERYTFPEGLSLVDGGTMGLDLLPIIEDTDSLLIVDAADFNAEPGEIRVVEGSDVKKFLDLKFSVHQIGVPDMLFAAAFSGILPKKICLVGIQPEKVDTGLELSAKLQNRMDNLLDVIIEKIQDWGIEVNEADNVSGNSVENR